MLNISMETKKTMQAEKKIPSLATETDIATRQRSVMLGIIAFLVFAFLTGAVIYQRYINLKNEKNAQALSVANTAKLRLQESLAYSLSATNTLSFCVRRDGTLNNFDSVASIILETSNYIDALQLVPDGVIRYVYPLEGNEKAIGYDILRDPARNKEAYKSIGKKEMFFAGPFELRQGGLGVVGRLPVFRNNKFWGFSAVVIKMPTLLRSAGIDSTASSGYYFQLSKINPDTKKEEYFIKHPHEPSRGYQVSVDVPNGAWKLSVIPVKPFKAFGDLALLAALALILSLIAGILVYSISRRPHRLNELVKERTLQLKESENNYRILFEGSPLPLWIYDMETFRFLEVNDAAISLYGYSRDEFLQMDVLAIRPEDEIQRFFDDNKNATDELRQSGEWTHVKKNKEEIKVLIFSKTLFYKGKKGRLVLILDVSEKIKIEEELIKSEEKYRLLIEQASDAIILYSFDGEIYSFNKAAYNLTGYSKEEFGKLHLKDLFFESPSPGSLEKPNTAETGMPTTLYRKMKRKDGSIFNVELNARMLPDGKILAIVRDITEREKIESALLKSEDKYRSLIERVTDAFISLDNNGNFTYVNNKAGEIYKIKPEELIGRNIWTSFPDGIDLAFYNKCNKAMKFQEYQYLEEFYPPLEKWFENHIYPSRDGLTIFFKDVTEIKMVSLALEEKEVKYRSLIEQASDGIVLTNLEGYIQEGNNSISRMSGYEIEEMIGKHLHVFLPEEDVELKPLQLEELKQGKSLLYERRLLRKDGTTLEVEVNSKMASNDTLIGFVRDISERKITEAAIKESEEKYRTLVEQATDGIFIADKEGRFLVINSSGYKMSQYSEEELKNMTIYDLAVQEDLEKDPFHFAEMMNNNVARTERRMRRKDGTLIDVEVTAKFISGERFLAFIRDITERKKAEDKLRYQARLLDSVSDAITSLDTERHIVSWNDACEELYGMTKEEVMGKRIPELVTFEYPGNTNEAVFRQVFSEGRWKGEFNFIHPKTGVKINLLSSINLLRNTEGDISGFIITSRDITDMKKAEEEIKISNERFELIAQATNDAVWDHDFAKNETWGNKKLYSLYGFDPAKDKLNLETFLSRVHPDERPGIEQRMRDALQYGQSDIAEEFRFMTGDEHYKIFYDRAHITYDAAGKPLRILGAMQDITDREKIRRQILKEKELSDSIINSLPGVFYLYNKEGKFLRWNKNFETVTGYSAEEISRMHPLDFFDEKDKQLLSEKIANVFVAGSDYVESDFLLKNGDKIPYYFTGQAIDYEDEVCLMGVGLDFSEKEKAARIIRESEEKYRTIIEQAADGIFLADKDSMIIDVNSAGCRMLGYSKEELQLKSYISLIPEEDLKNNPVLIDKLGSGGAIINERRLMKKDGTYIDVEISAKVLFDGRYQSIVRDITERKKAGKALRESEERYRALVENAPEALVVFDVDQKKFISVSESATRLFKMTKEELLQLGPVDVSTDFQPDGKPSEEAAKYYVQKALDGEKISFEWTHCDKDKNPISCEVWLVRLPSENQLLVRGSIVDITERKKAAEEIRVNSELLRDLYSYSQKIREEERTHIAREIHDELGQQLTGLKMDISWMNRKLKNTDEMISQKMAGTLDLIDATIQTVRKIATELRPSILDDLGLLAALEWQGEEFGKRSGIKVIFSGTVGEINAKPGVTTELFRIYQELLTNVARHSDAGTVKTSLYIEHDKLYLSVEDNGKGFDTDSIVSKKTLGLRGIKERTGQIGGNYEIKSKPGAGTFVLISVPLQ